MDTLTAQTIAVASMRAALWTAEDVLAEGGTEDEAYEAATATGRRVRERYERMLGAS